MREATKSVLGAVFYLSPVLLSFANSLVTEVLRPRFRHLPDSAIPFVLGWLPNYIAGLDFVSLGLAVLRLGVELGQGAWLLPRATRCMAGVAAFSLVGLVGWEFAQIDGRLVFDVHDIAASFGGVLTGHGVFLLARRYDPVLAGRGLGGATP